MVDLSLGEKLWGRKKKTYMRRDIRVRGPSGSVLDVRISRSQGDPSTEPIPEDVMARIIKEHLPKGGTQIVLDPMSLRPRKRLTVNVSYPQSREVVEFTTNRIAESDTLNRGVVRIDERMAATLKDISHEWDAEVSFAGRRIPMTLTTSNRLGLGEVELCRADIDELGISEGASGQLRITVNVPLGTVKRFLPPTTGRGADMDRRADDSGAPEVVFDDSLPYEVETGWRPFKRLRRK